MIGFVVTAIAAAIVAYLKGRTAFAAAGLLSVLMPAALLVIGRRLVSRQDDGLEALGMAMGYGTLMLIVAGALVGVAVVGAVLHPRTGSRWTRPRSKGSPSP
jgi:hypothetical protein